MTTEETPREEQRTDEESALRDDVLSILRARQFMPAKSVRMQMTERPVVGRKRRLVELDRFHRRTSRQLAYIPEKSLQREHLERFAETRVRE